LERVLADKDKQATRETKALEERLRRDSEEHLAAERQRAHQNLTHQLEQQKQALTEDYNRHLQRSLAEAQSASQRELASTKTAIDGRLREEAAKARQERDRAIQEMQQSHVKELRDQYETLQKAAAEQMDAALQQFQLDTQRMEQVHLHQIQTTSRSIEEGMEEKMAAELSRRDDRHKEEMARVLGKQEEHYAEEMSRLIESKGETIEGEVQRALLDAQRKHTQRLAEAVEEAKSTERQQWQERLAEAVEAAKKAERTRFDTELVTLKEAAEKEMELEVHSRLRETERAHAVALAAARSAASQEATASLEDERRKERLETEERCKAAQGLALRKQRSELEASHREALDHALFEQEQQFKDSLAAQERLESPRLKHLLEQTVANRTAELQDRLDEAEQARKEVQERLAKEHMADKRNWQAQVQRLEGKLEQQHRAESSDALVAFCESLQASVQARDKTTGEVKYGVVVSVSTDGTAVVEWDAGRGKARVLLEDLSPLPAQASPATPREPAGQGHFSSHGSGSATAKAPGDDATMQQDSDAPSNSKDAVPAGHPEMGAQQIGLLLRQKLDGVPLAVLLFGVPLVVFPILLSCLAAALRVATSTS